MASDYCDRIMQISGLIFGELFSIEVFVWSFDGENSSRNINRSGMWFGIEIFITGLTLV
jgi:hypothetical protein